MLPSVVAAFERLITHAPPACRSWAAENEPVLERVLSALVFAAGELGDEPEPATTSTKDERAARLGRGGIGARRDPGAGRANEGLSIPARTTVIDLESRQPHGPSGARQPGARGREADGGGVPPGAHVRHAHWHTFIYGPRNEPSLQQRRARWVRRTVVGA